MNVARQQDHGRSGGPTQQIDQLLSTVFEMKPRFMLFVGHHHQGQHLYPGHQDDEIHVLLFLFGQCQFLRQPQPLLCTQHVTVHGVSLVPGVPRPRITVVPHVQEYHFDTTYPMGRVHALPSSSGVRLGDVQEIQMQLLPF